MENNSFYYYLWVFVVHGISCYERTVEVNFQDTDNVTSVSYIAYPTDIPDGERNVIIQPYPHTDHVVKPPLPKCYCQVDHYWEDEMCHPKNTSVHLIKFDPFEMWVEPMRKYEDMVIGTPICDSHNMTLQTISYVYLQENDVLFHYTSGKMFKQYCLETVKNLTGDLVTEAQVCLPNYRIPSCCPRSYLFDHLSQECYVDDYFATHFYPPFKTGSNPNITPYHHAIPDCIAKEKLYREILDNTVNYLDHRDHEGVLFFIDNEQSNYGHPITLPSNYCVAMELNDQTLQYTVILWGNFPENECATHSTCDVVMGWLLVPLLVLSTISLLIILILHASIPNMTTTVGSKNMICHIASLFFGFCLLLLRFTSSNRIFCKVHVPLVQMSFLSSFFWLNVICFDLWRKLRSQTVPRETGQSSRRRFLCYSIYAWGCPAILVVITVIVDNIPSLEKIPWVVVPGFGKHYPCWFADSKATFFYYFLVIAVLMAVDAFLFLWVFVVLITASCTYGKVLNENKRMNKETLMYLKVFSVMGITWLFEYISWEEGTCQYWIITDIINALRGLILGVIFFGNKKTLNKISQRFFSINQSLHDQVNSSVSNFRNRTAKTSTVAISEITLESIKTSESNNEIHNRTNGEDSGKRPAKSASQDPPSKPPFEKT